ncbi:hypothetical protein AB6806_23740 [Bosea sp. RCC_152_1]|uniref:hypothetical protein n=1 Tax=Bosea sp. RCC_152_1 TaxID=3239228 RepID=UPI0035234D1E
MSDIIKCPEGVELDLVTYLTSPSKGIDTRVAARGFQVMVPLKTEIDVKAFVEANGLSKFADDWRVMTRDEIKEYKATENEE